MDTLMTCATVIRQTLAGLSLDTSHWKKVDKGELKMKDCPRGPVKVCVCLYLSARAHHTVLSLDVVKVSHPLLRVPNVQVRSGPDVTIAGSPKRSALIVHHVTVSSQDWSMSASRDPIAKYE